jgi:hypothetical protein
LGLVAAVVIACVASARAQPAERSVIEVVLEPPARLGVGARAEVIARVRLGEDAGRPMLLTPATEGTAIEVVRGRLTRADADAQTDDGGELRFRIPIVARMVGTAVLRVRIDGFACRDGRCTALQIEESVAIEVHPAGASVPG